MPNQFPRNEEGEWTFHYTGGTPSGDVVVTMGFFVEDAGSYDQGTNDDVSGAWEDVVASTLCSQMTYTRLTTLVADGTAISAWETISNTPGGLTGNTMLPLNNAVVVKKQTGLAGRRNRGRLYLPGIPEDAVDDNGLVLGSFLTTINNKITDFATAVGILTPSCVCAILHKDITIPAKEEYVLEGMPHTLITSFAADVILGSQRDRLQKP